MSESDSLLHKALLIIDVQNEYFTGRLPVTYPTDSFINIIKIMDHARQRKMPVIVIQHTAPDSDSPVFKKGSKEWQLHPLIYIRKWNHLIEKNLPGSFTGTDLDSWLQKRNINTVVITGYMTQMCCDTTARQAFHAGYSVEFISDATGTLSITNAAGSVKDEELHRSILVTQAMRFSSVLTTAQWLEDNA